MSRPLNVLQFICSTGYYGAERWVVALANNADRNLVNIELAVTQEHAHHQLQVSDEFINLGLPSHVIPMTGAFDLRLMQRLKALIKERNIDLIHTHGYKSDIIGLLVAKMAGIKCVSTPHGFEMGDDLKLKLYIGLSCRLFRYFDAVVPLSEQLVEDVRGFKVKPEKLRLIENGVDLKPIDTLREQLAQSPLGDRAPAIGYIGQLIKRKNVNDLITAFARLRQDHHDLRLILLGDGEERSALEAQVATLGVADAVDFAGYQDEALAWHQRFDVFAMTSNLEGIPRCLMESMALETPIVAYDIPGVDQLIVDEETGLLAPFGDVDKLVKQCARLLDDKPFADRIADRAFETVNARFSAQRMAREYESLFSDIVGSSRD